MERACACALSACAHECVCACVRAYVRVPLSVRVLTRTCACVCVRACVRVGARACVCARPGVLSTSRWSQQHTVFGSRRLPDDVIRGRGGHVRYVIGRNWPLLCRVHRWRHHWHLESPDLKRDHHIVQVITYIIIICIIHQLVKPISTHDTIQTTNNASWCNLHNIMYCITGIVAPLSSHLSLNVYNIVLVLSI